MQHHPVVTHQRLYGEQKLSSMNWLPYLRSISSKPSSLFHSGIFDMIVQHSGVRPHCGHKEPCPDGYSVLFQNQGMFGCRWGRKHISRHREQFFHRHFSFCNGTDECRSYGHYRRYLYATNQKADGI